MMNLKKMKKNMKVKIKKPKFQLKQLKKKEI